MLSQFPQQAGDVVTVVLLALAIVIAFAAWIAGMWDTHNPLQDDEPDECDDHGLKDVDAASKPRHFVVDAEANAIELHRFAALRDLARGTSDNLSVKP